MSSAMNPVLAVAVAVAVSACAVSPAAVDRGSSSPGERRTPVPESPAAATASASAPLAFASRLYPYTLELPAGWSVVASSQAAASDEDAFADEDRVHWATVGSGVPEAGQTLEDRVEIGRQQFPDCSSDPSQDRPIEMGAEPAVLWAYECGDSYHLAAQTLHAGVGYRMTVHVAADELSLAHELMSDLLSNFAFTEAD